MEDIELLPPPPPPKKGVANRMEEDLLPPPPPKKKDQAMPTGSETSAPSAEIGSPTSPSEGSKTTPPSDIIKPTKGIDYNAIRTWENFQEKRKSINKETESDPLVKSFTKTGIGKDLNEKAIEDANNSYKLAESNINGLANSVIESGKINFVDASGQPDIRRIAKFANNVAETQGMLANGYFAGNLRRSIETILSAKKIAESPEQIKNFSNLYKKEYGTDFDFEGKEANSIYGQAKIKKVLIEKEIKNDSETKLNTYKDQEVLPQFKTIETNYKSAVEQLQAQAGQDPEAAAVNEKFYAEKTAELTSLVQQGQITLEMGNNILKSEELKAQAGKTVNDFLDKKYKPAFDAAYKQYSFDRTAILNKSLQFQNEVNSKAGARFERQMEELKIEVERKTKGLTGDKKKLADLWNKAFEITARDKNLTQLENENKIFSIGGLSFVPVATTAISSFARMMRTSAECFGLNELALSAEILEKKWQGASDPTTEFKDLFNWSKLSRSAGNLAGSALPSIAVGYGVAYATRGSQLPLAARIAMGGITSFSIETPSIMGEAYSSMLAKTGSESDAQKAYVTSFKSQIASMPLYMMEGVKFFPSVLKKVPFLGKTAAGRAIAGATSSFTGEFFTEGWQGLAERAYMNKQDLSRAFDEGWLDNLKVTGLNIAPTILTGGLGSLAHSGYYNITGSLAARKIASSKSFANLIPEQKSQFLAKLALAKNESYVSVVLSTMLTSGSITQEEFDNIAPFVANISENQKLVVEAKKNGANNQNQLFLSTLLSQRDNLSIQVQDNPSLQPQLDELNARIGEISSGKNEDLYGIVYKDNSHFVFDEKTYKSLMADNDFITSLKNKDVRIFFGFDEKSKRDSAIKAHINDLYGFQITPEVETTPKVTAPVDSEKRAEEQRQLDEKITAFQERTGYKPDDLSVDLNTGITLDRLDNGIPVDPIAVEEASNYLYQVYKKYERMLELDSRRMTTDQIKGLMSELEGYITKLENVKNGKDFNAEVATGTAPLESTADTGVDTVVEAPKAYQESISSRDIEQGFGEDTVEGFLDSQYYADIIASAKAEGLTAAQVIKDLYKQNAFDNLETREDIDAIEVQLKRDLASNAAPVATAEQVEPIDEFIEANYTQIVADLKLANKIKTEGCAY